MFVITGTRHSGTLFLNTTLQSSGLRPVSRKRVLAGATPPFGTMVSVPIPDLGKVLDRSTRVVALIRPWRAWARLMSDEQTNPALPHEVAWWFSNYRLVSSLMRTESRFQLLSHDNLLARPDISVRRVLRFLGREAAFEETLLLPAIAPSRAWYPSQALDRDEQAVLDAFWEVVHDETPMTRGLFQRMNGLQERLRRRYPSAGAVPPMPTSLLKPKLARPRMPPPVISSVGRLSPEAPTRRRA